MKSSASSIQQAEELVSSQPSPDTYLNLSLQYHNAGRFEDSIKACKKALKIDPNYYLAYNNICSAYNELKMWDKAIKACKNGLSIQPDFQRLQNNLTFAHQQKSRHESIRDK
jgi:Tfp pilus assembly protein PilF